MCDQASIDSAVAAFKVHADKTLSPCQQALIEGTHGFKPYCSSIGFFDSEDKPTPTYRLNYAPDRIPDIEENAPVDWDRLNLKHTKLHFPFSEPRDLLSQAAFRADFNAWKPQNVLRRGELPGGMRTAVDWRFIGGAPPCKNGQILVKSRRRSINFKRVNQLGSTCSFTGHRNAQGVARCAELGEFSREPLLGNVAHQAFVMYVKTHSKAKRTWPNRTTIDVYRTLDDTSCYIWKWSETKKNGIYSAVSLTRQNEGNPQKTFFEVKSDPSTKEILNKDYALDSEEHNYTRTLVAPDSDNVSRAFVSHERPGYYDEDDPGIDYANYKETESGDTSEPSYPTLSDDGYGRIAPLTDEEQQTSRSSRAVDWEEASKIPSTWAQLVYASKEYQVDPFVKPYVDSKYLPTTRPGAQTKICGSNIGLREGTESGKSIRTLLGVPGDPISSLTCGSDTSVPVLYAKCYDGRTWFAFQASRETEFKTESKIKEYFGAEVPTKNRDFFNGIPYSFSPTSIDKVKFTPRNNHFWITACKNMPIFSLGELAQASPALFMMMVIDELGPMVVSRTGPCYGKDCRLTMAETLGISLDEARQIVHPEYLIDGSGSKTDLAMREILLYFRGAPFAETIHPGGSSNHTLALVGYVFHPSAPEYSYFITENSHWTAGNTYTGQYVFRMNFTHAWAGFHLFERDFSGWNHNILKGQGGFGRPVKYYYDGTVQLPGDFADPEKVPNGKFMGDTNELRGASKYNHTMTGDFDPSGQTLAFVGNGMDEHCGVGAPAEAEGNVTPPLLPNFRAMRLLSRTNARSEEDFATYGASKCDSTSSSQPIKTQSVSNLVEAANLCTIEENCNFVEVTDNLQATFYESCAPDNDDSNGTVLQRKSTIVESTAQMQVLEKYYGNYQDVCLGSYTGTNKTLSKSLALPSGYRLMNGPGCTTGSATSKKSLKVCAATCTGDCSHVSYNYKTKECRTCTGAYAPLIRGPCDLITAIPVPRGSAPSVLPSGYKNFGVAGGHFCENRGYTNSIAVVSSVTSTEECIAACYENPLCNYAQLQGGSTCALLDVCPEFYPTDDDNLSVYIRGNYEGVPANVTIVDGTARASVQAISFLPLSFCLVSAIVVLVLLLKVVPTKITDPKRLLIARILLGLFIGSMLVLGISVTTAMAVNDTNAAAALEAKQYVGAS